MGNLQQYEESKESQPANSLAARAERTKQNRTTADQREQMVLGQVAERTERVDKKGQFGGDFTVQETDNDRAQSPSYSFIEDFEDDWSDFQDD